MPSFSSIARDETVVVREGRRVTLPVPGRIEFEVSGLDIAYVNGLRRSLIGDVVTAAVAFDPNDPDGQDLAVTHNTGVLHNEFVGSRVSLIPVHLTRAELSRLKPDRVSLELDVANADGDRPLDVTSRDIRVSGGGLDRDRVFPPDPVTGMWPLITVLMPPGDNSNQVQRLAFKASLSLGTGRDHARHSPVSACAVFPVADAALVAEARAKSGDAATFDTVEAPHLWKAAADGSQPAAHRVSLESVCGIPPDELVAMGFEAMASRMRRVAEKLSDPASEDVADEEPMHNSPDVAGVKLRGETETAGALIQAHLLGDDPEAPVPAPPRQAPGQAPQTAPGQEPRQLLQQQQSSFGSCDFCGYFTPHPLQQCIIVRLRPKNPDGPSARDLVRHACLAVSVRAQQLADDWAKASGAGGGGDSDSEGDSEESGASSEEEEEEEDSGASSEEEEEDSGASSEEEEEDSGASEEDSGASEEEEEEDSGASEEEEEDSGASEEEEEDSESSGDSVAAAKRV